MTETLTLMEQATTLLKDVDSTISAKSDRLNQWQQATELLLGYWLQLKFPIEWQDPAIFSLFKIMSQLAIKIDSSAVYFLRSTLIENVLDATITQSQYQQLVAHFYLIDSQNEYLHPDWMKSDELFLCALNTFVDEKSKSCDQIKLTSLLLKVLQVCLTYRTFTVNQAKALIAKLPFAFDPRQALDPSDRLKKTYLEEAKPFCNQDMLAYLESFPIVQPIVQREIRINLDDFQELLTLFNMQQQPVQLSEGNQPFVKLKSINDICQFCNIDPTQLFNPNRYAEEMKALMNQYSLISSEEALAIVKGVYQGELSDCSDLILQLEAGDIEIYSANNLQLNNNLCSDHPNVGTLSFNGNPVVCKYQHTNHVLSGTNLFQIHELYQFIQKVRALKQQVPQLVEIFPYILLNKMDNGDINIGYFMEVVPGKTFRQIDSIDISDKEKIRQQFNQAVLTMFDLGYAIYDFHDDNIMWDGNRLTFIDLSPSGFKASALENADTYDVIDRMLLMLGRRLDKNQKQLEHSQPMIDNLSQEELKDRHQIIDESNHAYQILNAMQQIHLHIIKFEKTFTSSSPSSALNFQYQTVRQLKAILWDEDIPLEQRLTQFYQSLDKAHLDPRHYKSTAWNTFEKVLIGIAMMLTGILPGLVVLAVYQCWQVRKEASLRLQFSLFSKQVHECDIQPLLPSLA